MQWELRNDRQIWLQLAEHLTRGIVAGEYPAGTKMPSVRDLAAEAGVNPNTMQRALSSLEESGLVEARRSSGRYVTQDAALIAERRNALAQRELESFREKMLLLGYGREEIAEFFKTKGEEI